MRNQHFFPLFAMMILCFQPAGYADPQPIIHKPTYMALFKNGTSLVVSEARLNGNEGEFRVHPIPQSSLGSFWLSWPEHMELSNVRATKVLMATEVPAITIPELLQANIGQMVEIKIQNDWERVKIVDIPKRKKQPDFIPMEGQIVPPPQPPKMGEMVILENTNGKQAIPTHWVQAMRFLKDDARFEIKHEEQTPVIEFEASGRTGGPDSNVYITFLAQGASWSPSYQVDISDEDEADFSAKAIVLNDLFPMEDTEVELITGFPHIQYANVDGAFTLNPLAQLLNQIEDDSRRGERRARALSNTMVGQRVMLAADFSAPSMPDTPVHGETEEDLFFYQLNEVTLKKGERGYFPLFSAEVDYEHLYTWDIPDYVDQNNRYQQQQAEQDRPEIWHTLKLTNDTSRPWTTAPAMTVKGSRILGQDTLNFTPPGASSELKITQAASIKAEHNEYEIEREPNAARYYSDNYDLVTIRGEMALTNYSEKEIQLEITKTVSGEVTKTDGEPEVKKLAKGLRMVNPRSQLVWNLELEPGKEESRTLEYEYKIYVRN